MSTVTLTSLSSYAFPVNLSCSVAGTGSPSSGMQRNGDHSTNTHIRWRNFDGHHHHDCTRRCNDSSEGILLRAVAAGRRTFTVGVRLQNLPLAAKEIARLPACWDSDDWPDPAALLRRQL